MKTLKKLLCVVLALAMVLGMTVTASATFADADKITAKYQEAVDVMSAVGVFVGDGGKLDPQANLTRAQAAKIIAYLDLGKTVAEALPAVAVFADVNNSHWAAKYIAYCKDAGYVAGVGANKYDPEAEVTGYQFAKMLLTVLGYDAELESMLGTTWQIATSKLMQKTGIGKGVGYKGVDALTREEACQMAFEAIKATCVEYQTKGTTLSVNGVEIKTGASAAKTVENTATKYNAGTEGTMQLCEKLYPTLKLTTVDADEFGRPAHSWKLGTVAVGQYTDAATLTYTTKVFTGTIYSDLGLTASLTDDCIIDGLDSADVTLSKGGVTALGGNGVLTEVYDLTSGDTKAFLIVQINTYVGTVASVTAATSSADRYVTLTNYSTLPGTTDKTFETDDLAKKDVVAFTVAYNKTASKYEIQSVEALAKAADGKVTSVVNSTDLVSFVINGTTYTTAAKFATDARVTVDSEIDVYLDQYGYAIRTEVTKKATNYAVVVGVGSIASQYGEANKVGLTLLLPDGTTKQVVAVAKNNATTALFEGIKQGTSQLLTSSAYGAVVTYTVGTTGVYTVDASSNAYYIDNVSANDTIGGSITNGVSTLTIKVDDLSKDGVVISAKTFYATDDTIFFVADEDSTGEYDNYKVYVGYKNVPTIAGDGNIAAASVVCDPVNKSIAKAVYVAADTVSGFAGDNMFVLVTGLETVTSVTTAEGTVSYKTYAAVVDGQKTTVKVDSGLAIANINAKGSYILKSTNVDANGIITDLSLAKAGSDYYSCIGTVAADGSVVGFDPTMDATNGTVTSATYKSFIDDALVVVVNVVGYDFTVETISDVDTDANDAVNVVYDIYGRVAEVYITKNADAYSAASVEVKHNISGGNATADCVIVGNNVVVTVKGAGVSGYYNVDRTLVEVTYGNVAKTFEKHSSTWECGSDEFAISNNTFIVPVAYFAE